MYWWNVSKLAEDLREGRVDEKERFKVLSRDFYRRYLAGQLFFNSGDTFSIERLISVTVILAFTVIGIIVCYKANKSGDNTDFIARMICLVAHRHPTRSDVIAFCLGLGGRRIPLARHHLGLSSYPRVKRIRVVLRPFIRPLLSCPTISLFTGI